MAILDSVLAKALFAIALLGTAFRDSFRFWTPGSLAEYLSLPRPHAEIIDPNNYLDRESAAKAAARLRSISSYPASLIIVNGLDRFYISETGKTMDLDRFLRELMPQAFASARDRDNRLVVFYSIEDDDFRCAGLLHRRTHRRAQFVFTVLGGDDHGGRHAE